MTDTHGTKMVVPLRSCTASPSDRNWHSWTRVHDLNEGQIPATQYRPLPKIDFMRTMSLFDCDRQGNGSI